MALPSTGAISLLDVRNELGKTGAISLNDSDVRSLAGKTSGTISMSDLRGKSSFAYTHTLKIGKSPSQSYGYVEDGFVDPTIKDCGSITPNLIRGYKFYYITVSSNNGKYFFNIYTYGANKNVLYTVTLPNGATGTSYDTYYGNEVTASFYQYFVQNLNKTINIRIEYR